MGSKLEIFPFIRPDSLPADIKNTDDEQNQPQQEQEICVAPVQPGMQATQFSDHPFGQKQNPQQAD